ncbi:MAG: phytase [Bacteroidales bacterium]|nr:phytase [Bacteroidales bacterium]MBN2819484.1 phytase [Bacteroidales bacterium]
MNKIFFIIALAISTLQFSCKQESRIEPIQREIVIHHYTEPDSIKNLEAREDSIEMAITLAKNKKFQNRVWAFAETDPVNSEIGEDAADDPAIWVNKYAPERSLVIGTQKKAGLYVYDLNGETKQFLPVGSINNVDLRDGFMFENREVCLVAGSNRSLNTISLFYIDPEKAVLSDSIANIKSDVDEVYGICMYRSTKTRKFFVMVNGKGGEIEQWEISSDNSIIKAKMVREFTVESQPEGMVADDVAGTIYLGVEEKGICKINAEPDYPVEPIWIESSFGINQYIDYDIEGLTIYNGTEKKYLLASIQGNFSYAVWEIGKDGTETYITSFVIWETNNFIDGVEETDGLDVVSVSLNKQYQKGLLVVQDGFNFESDTLSNQNFKYISWNLVDVFLK